MSGLDGKRGDNVSAGTLGTLCGEKAAEVHPSFRVSRKQSARYVRYVPSTDFT